MPWFMSGGLSMGGGLAALFASMAFGTVGPCGPAGYITSFFFYGGMLFLLAIGPLLLVLGAISKIIHHMRRRSARNTNSAILNL